MAFSVSPNALRSPRYAVIRSMREGVSYAALTIEGTQYVEYCETFADVKARLKHHAGKLQDFQAQGQARFYWVQTPDTWYAGAVWNSCKNRRRAFVVANSTNGKITEWLTVILLK